MKRIFLMTVRDYCVILVFSGDAFGGVVAWSGLYYIL